MVAMSTLNRKLLRDLVRSRGLLIAVLAILTVGVACYVAMRSSQHNLESALARYYARCHLADVWIDVKKAPSVEVRERLDLPGVASIVPRVSFMVTADLPGVERPVSGQVISLPDRPAGLNDLIMVSGVRPRPEAENELLIIQQFAEARDLKPGDEIHLILNNRRQPFRITGIALSAEFVYLMSPGSIVPAAEHFGVFYLPERAAADVFDFDGACNSILLRLDPSLAEAPRPMLDAMERALDPYGVFRVTPRREFPSHWFISDELKQLGTTGMILPSIFLAVAVLVLNILMIRLIEQQRTIVGILKAFGYTNGQIRAHYLKFALAIGLTGGVLGGALGYGLASALTILYRQFYVFPDLTSALHWDALGIGVALGLAASGLGAVRGVAMAVRLQPAEAMRPKPPVTGRSIWLERLGLLWRRLDLGWRMSLRGLARQRARTGAGLTAAALGSAIMLTAFGMQDAMRYMVRFQFDQVLRADASLVFDDERPFGVVREVERLPGVHQVEPVFEVACTFINGRYEKRGGITGILPEARLTTPSDAQGRPVSVPHEGLVMTRALADRLHLSVGDRVTIEPVRGPRLRFTMRLASVVDSFLGLAAYADFHTLNRAMGEVDSVSSVQVTVERGEASERALARSVKSTPAVQTISLIREQQREFEDLLATTNASITVLIMFAGVIMMGSIVTSALITLSERQREVATLRTLGYFEGEVSRLFLRENLVVNINGALLGLPIGYALLVLTSVAYQTEAFRIPVRVAERSWILTPMLAIAFTLIAQFVIRRSIQRLAWREVLNVRD